MSTTQLTLTDRERIALAGVLGDTEDEPQHVRVALLVDKLNEIRTPDPLFTLRRDDIGGTHYWKTDQGWLRLGNATGIPQAQSTSYRADEPPLFIPDAELPRDSVVVYRYTG